MTVKKIGNLCVSGCIFYLAIQVAFSQKATLSVSPVAIKKGSPFYITVNLENMDGMISFPESADYEVRGQVKTAQNYAYFDGKKLELRAITYEALAKKEGKIKVGPALIKTPKNVVKTNTANIEISDVNDMFLQAKPLKKAYYVGEPVITDYTFYTLDANASQYSELAFDQSNGMVSIVKIPGVRTFNRANIKGRNYYSAVIGRTVMLPLVPGKSTIPVGATEITINRRTETGFESFFGQGFSLQEQRFLESPQGEIEILPLPESGKPAHFNNAVGEFDITAGVDRNSIKANDGIHYYITISGYGNLSMIRPPELVLPKSIKAYLPETLDSIATGVTGMTGSRTFIYTLIPRSGGTYTIPPFTFSYFDPEKKKYESFQTDSFTITIDGRSIPDDSLDLMNSLDTAMVKDIITDQDFRKYKTSSFIGSTGFYILFALSLLVSAGLVYFRKPIEQFQWRNPEKQQQKKLMSWKTEIAAYTAYADVPRFEALFIKGAAILHPQENLISPVKAGEIFRKYSPETGEIFQKIYAELELARYAQNGIVNQEKIKPWISAFLASLS